MKHAVEASLVQRAKPWWVTLTGGVAVGKLRGGRQVAEHGTENRMPINSRRVAVLDECHDVAVLANVANLGSHINCT